MSFIENDFVYYERSIKQMYQKYYWKRIIVCVIVLLIIMAYSSVFREHLLFNYLLMGLIVALTIYLYLEKQKFPEIYQAYLNENKPEAKIVKIQEDEYSYSVIGNKNIRINKNGVRNFPSSNKKYTMMVGFSKSFFSLEPLQIVYYDMLELTYEKKFRLKRNGYQSMPRFLRRFTLDNLKASAGNMWRFIAGNILILIILFRVLRYLWSFIQMLF